jgi:membrane-associated phospholipid phosphatase
MPSLHVAWALWAGWLITRHAHHRLTRIAGASYPMLTAFVVIATGNHYLLDVLAGAAVLVLASLAIRQRPDISAPMSSRRPAGVPRMRFVVAFSPPYF